MRMTFAGLILGFGLLVGAVVPSFACAFQDQAAADTQQQTAQAQPAQPSETSTQ